MTSYACLVDRLRTVQTSKEIKVKLELQLGLPKGREGKPTGKRHEQQKLMISFRDGTKNSWRISFSPPGEMPRNDSWDSWLEIVPEKIQPYPTMELYHYIISDDHNCSYRYMIYNNTLQGVNIISHLGKRKIIFKIPFWGDMLVPWRVYI